MTPRVIWMNWYSWWLNFLDKVTIGGKVKVVILKDVIKLLIARLTKLFMGTKNRSFNKTKHPLLARCPHRTCRMSHSIPSASSRRRPRSHDELCRFSSHSKRSVSSLPNLRCPSGLQIQLPRCDHPFSSRLKRLFQACRTWWSDDPRCKPQATSSRMETVRFGMLASRLRSDCWNPLLAPRPPVSELARSFD